MMQGIRPVLLFFGFLGIIFSTLFSSCGNDPRPTQSARHLSMMDDSLILYNKEIVNDENQQIDDYIARYHYEMNKTATGLRYMFRKHGTGVHAVKDKIVVISYTVKLLNGDLCYSCGKDNPKEFRTGHSNTENGLEEGILLMRAGDQVKFIVPSHLAFGLLGDQNKIPRRATLVYDVELLNVK